MHTHTHTDDVGYKVVGLHSDRDTSVYSETENILYIYTYTRLYLLFSPTTGTVAFTDASPTPTRFIVERLY